jgi:hypothetical protein
MNVFEYRDAVITEHRAFTTSFTKIKAPDIQQLAVLACTNYPDTPLLRCG